MTYHQPNQTPSLGGYFRGYSIKQFVTACFFASSLIGLLSTYSFGSELSLDKNKQEQELLYKKTLIQIRKGQFKQAHKGIYQLRDYPLSPYLEKALLYKRIGLINHHQTQQYLTRYSGSIPAQQFRKKWLLHLAKQKRWQSFTQFYVESEANTTLRCHYIEALHQQQRAKHSFTLTSKIWLTGKSLPKACDNALKRWQLSGANTDELIWQRAKLALAENNYTLARYLAKYAQPTLQTDINSLISYHKKPGSLKPSSQLTSDRTHAKDIVLVAMARLADKNVELAATRWPYYQQTFTFNQQEQQSINQLIARNLIAGGHQQTLAWLIKTNPNGEDQFLLEWRILLAVKQQHWADAIRWINLLPGLSKQQPQWQYWLAKVELKINKNSATAYEQLSTLANQRHYYGFLAASYLNKKYSFEERPTPYDLNYAEIKQIPAIQRAKTFYQMGETVAARREWHNATVSFTPSQQLAASVLAQQWNWHQQVILSSSKANHKDDLALRFPLAYKNNILPAAETSQLQPEWIYAITRQESAFASDAQSPAGARGLMQLRPNTAKEIAKQIGLTYKHKDIYQANTNIILGSRYLQTLLDTFKGNKILATAAFNAGPYRVKKWLKRQPQKLDYDIWIETLPYYETRNYIKNVLASAVIYGHRLGRKIPVVDSHEELINHGASTD